MIFQAIITSNKVYAFYISFSVNRIKVLHFGYNPPKNIQKFNSYQFLMPKIYCEQNLVDSKKIEL
jgi:hypothetical protein